MTRAKVLQSAASAVRMPAPADVVAASELWTSEPETFIRLRDAVVAACAALPGNVDRSTVASIAVLSVARHYARHGDLVHAVRAAVMGARQTAVLATLADVESVEVESPDDVAVRVESTSIPRVDAIASENALRANVDAALSVLSEDDGKAWQAIRAAWLAHVPASCDACSEPGARPSRLTLSSIRAHVSGLSPADSASKRMRERDAALVARVAELVAVVRERGGYVDGAMSSPLAHALVIRGDAAITPSADAGIATPYRTSVTVDAPLTVAGKRETRESESVERHAARVAVRVEQGKPFTERPSYFRVGEHAVTGTVRRLSEIRPVAAWLPRMATAPTTDVTVTRADGSAVTRPMTEVELGATDRVQETVMVAGEEVPVVRADYAGEEGMRGGTAPAGARDRVAGEPDGAVRSFKPVVSPRKRPAGNTGPTIPVTLR